MNNMALRLGGKRAAFVIKAANGGFRPEAGEHTYTDGDITLIHDIGNSGSPGKYPRILDKALEAVDPTRVTEITDPYDCEPRTPRSIVLLSQYPPDGEFFNALKDAATTKHAGVYVPRQPSNDHRERFPRNLTGMSFRRMIDSKKTDSGIVSERRDVPSHIKILVVTYTNGTAKVIFGTDNFETHLKKLVRNEEIAAVISIDGKDIAQAEWFSGLVNLLFDMREITDPLKDRLLDDVCK